MAHRTGWIGADQQRIVVAVEFDFDDLKKVTRRFPFCPEALFRTAEERDSVFLHGLLISFFIHKSDHEDAQCLRVLDNTGDQAVIL